MREYGEQNDIEIIEKHKKNERILPILEYRDIIVEQIKQNETTIVMGETGSGKTTEIPQFLMDEFPDKKIVVTEPRKIAASSISSYVAKQKDIKLGEKIGYKVRFEDFSSEGTMLNFVTDGLLLQECKSDPLLLKYDIVMVDEAHERSLNIDFTLGLLKNAQRERKEKGEKELKIIVTSATLEKEKFANYFSESPIVEVPGRLHPVDVEYVSNLEKDDYGNINTPKSSANIVKKIVDSGKEGDVLIFMPREQEILATVEKLKDMGLSDNIEILPIYGRLPPEEQQKVFQKFDKRKVVIATNIAETSITIDGIKFVIDSGNINEKDFNPKTGIESMTVKEHAKSGCEQRKGRAGRTAPGICYRLYSEGDFNMREKFQKPEIARSNLDHTVLLMKKMGINDVVNFDFIDPPKTESFTHALETLQILGALDEDMNLTEMGNKMSEFPLSPEKSRMLIEAEKYGCVESVATIAAMVGNKPVFNRPKDFENEADLAHQQFKAGDSDFITLLNVWKKWEESGHNVKWARANFLNHRQLFEAGEIRFQLMERLKRLNIIPIDTNGDEELVAKSISAGMIQNFMFSTGFGQYTKFSDLKPYNISPNVFFVHPSSSIFRLGAQFIVGANVVNTSKSYARLCQKIEPEWLLELMPNKFRLDNKSERRDYQRNSIVETYTYVMKNSSRVYFNIEKTIPLDEEKLKMLREQDEREWKERLERTALLMELFEERKSDELRKKINEETYDEETTQISQEEFLRNLKERNEKLKEEYRLAKEARKSGKSLVQENIIKTPEKEIIMTETLREDFDKQLNDYEFYFDILRDVIQNIQPKKDEQKREKDNIKNNLKEYRKRFNEFKKEIGEIDSVSRIKGLLANIFGEVQRVSKRLEKDNFLPENWINIYNETVEKALFKAKEAEIPLNEENMNLLKEKIAYLTSKNTDNSAISDAEIGNIVFELI